MKICKFLGVVGGLMLCLPVIAQNTAGTINGRVTDPEGAVIPGAAVTVTSTATNVAHAVKTNQDGLYTVPLLQPGNYTVSVTSPNFKTALQNNVTLQIQQTLELDFKLSLGSTTQTVTVTTAAPLIQTQTASVGTVINNRTVLQIPLNGRQFYNLVELVPGAMPPVVGSSLSYRGGFNVAGQPETSNYYTLDGINNVDIGVSSPNVRPSVEAIQEFRLVTGEYESEFGHNIGGQLVVTTKSGSNSFHGDLYEFLRNQMFDAKNYFQPHNEKLSLKRSDAGMTLGGPVIRNKMFFFFSTEFLRLSNQYSQLSTVPTTTQIAGTYAGHLNIPNNPDGTSYPLAAFVYDPHTDTTTIDPTKFDTQAEAQAYTVGAALLSFYPAVTTPGGSNYTYSAPNREDSELYELRLDNAIDAKNSTYVTLHWFNDPIYTPNNPTCGAANIPGFLCYAGYLADLYGGGWTHIFTPNVINNFVAGFQRLNVPRNSLNSTPFDAEYNIPAFTGSQTPSIINGVPFVTINGYSTYGNTGNLPQNRYDNTYDYNDSVLWNKGSHSFKFGVEYTRLISELLYAANARGNFTFNGTYTGNPVADALLGLPTEAQRTPTAPIEHDKQTYIAGYAQDSWKAFSNLTLNYGVRWETQTPSTASNAPQTVQFIPSTGEAYVAGTNGTPRHAWHAYNGGWGPRLGVAYRPAKNDDTVVQAGVSVTYDVVYDLSAFLGTQDVYPDRLAETYQGTVAAPLSLPDPFVGGGSVALNTSGTDPYFPMPRNVGYSLGVEQKLTPSTVLTLTYQGSETSHIYETFNLNQARPQATAALGSTSRPYTQWNNITWGEARGHSNYNALYAKLQQNLSHGLSYLISYTWAKAEDDADQEGGTVQNIYDIKAEKGISIFNVPERIVASPVYQLPFGSGREFLNQGWASKIVGGWEIASQIAIQSGTFGTPTDGANVSNNGESSGDRPYVTDDPNLGPHQLNEWFNVFDYNYQNVVSGTPAPVGTTVPQQLANSFPGITVVPPTPEPYGNARHGSIHNPGYKDMDVNIARTFVLPRKMSMEFRAEVFNVFNHPNFNPPGTTFVGFTQSGGVVKAAGSFGHITGAQDGRDVQFAVKIFY